MTFSVILIPRVSFDNLHFMCCQSLLCGSCLRSVAPSIPSTKISHMNMLYMYIYHMYNVLVELCKIEMASEITCY